MQAAASEDVPRGRRLYAAQGQGGLKLWLSPGAGEIRRCMTVTDGTGMRFRTH